MTTTLLSCCCGCPPVKFLARTGNSNGDVGGSLQAGLTVTPADCSAAPTLGTTPFTRNFDDPTEITVSVQSVPSGFPVFDRWAVYHSDGSVVHYLDDALVLTAGDVVTVVAVFVSTVPPIPVPNCDEVMLYAPERLTFQVPATIDLSAFGVAFFPAGGVSYHRPTGVISPAEFSLECIGYSPVPWPGYLDGHHFYRWFHSFSGYPGLRYEYRNAYGLCATAYLQAMWIRTSWVDGGTQHEGFVAALRCVLFLWMYRTDVPEGNLVYFDSWKRISPVHTLAELLAVYKTIAEHSDPGPPEPGEDFYTYIDPAATDFNDSWYGRLPPGSPLWLYPSIGGLVPGFGILTTDIFDFDGFFLEREVASSPPSVSPGFCLSAASPTSPDPDCVDPSNVSFAIQAYPGGSDNDTDDCRCIEGEDLNRTTIAYTGPGDLDAEDCELDCDLLGGNSGDAFPAHIELELPDAFDSAWWLSCNGLIGGARSGIATRHPSMPAGVVLEAKCGLSGYVGIGSPGTGFLFHVSPNVELNGAGATGRAARVLYNLSDADPDWWACLSIELEIGIVRPWRDQDVAYPYTRCFFVIKVGVSSTTGIYDVYGLYAFNFGSQLTMTPAELLAATPWILNSVPGFDPNWQFDQFFLQRFGLYADTCEFSIDPDVWATGRLKQVCPGPDATALCGCDLASHPELAAFENWCPRTANHVYPFRVKPTSALATLYAGCFDDPESWLVYCDNLAVADWCRS